MPASALRKHDLQFREDTTAGPWEWTTRMDLTGARPAFQVLNVWSPWGNLRDSIPIPGAVILAMQASIAEMQSQFEPNILLGPPTSFTITLDEGRGESDGDDVLVTNNGVYGSLLGVSITSDETWLRASTNLLGNLAFNESGTFQLFADSTDLIATSSPYSATITLTDEGAGNNPVTIPVTVVVRPKATITVDDSLLIFTVVKPVSGSFPSVPTQTFTLSNSGLSGSLLDYQIQKLCNVSPWLMAYNPATGTLEDGEEQIITVTVVVPDGTALGTFEETLRISGYSSNSYTDVTIRLIVS